VRIPHLKTAFVLLLVGWATWATAVDYYVSSAGDDAASGTSPAAAWRTAGRVTAHDLDPGDRVLFEGGTTFPDRSSWTARMRARRPSRSR
jgi:hypothetical protein